MSHLKHPKKSFQNSSSPLNYAAIGSATLASCQEIDLITNDRIQSTTAGWGALPVACYVVSNVVAEAIQVNDRMKVQERRKGIRISNNDSRKTPVEAILEHAILALKNIGVENSDAALLSAASLYFSGVNVRSGVAAGAKSLGRMARLVAEAERGGVSLLCSHWSTSRVSAFAAVQAIYVAMRDRKLTSVDGRRLPLGVGGAPIVDDSVLGEDIIGPEISSNGARIGTQAMLEAFAGVGLPPNKIISALFGTAAILEIVHTDSMVGEDHGPYGSVNTIHVAGRSAAKVAGIPEYLHVRGTREPIESGKFIGELALILKECGSPSTIGMLALQEMLAIFEEGLDIGAGFSAGPVGASLGFLNSFATLGIKYLQHFDWDMEKAADLLQHQFNHGFIDPEYSCLGYNSVARMAEGLHPGMISRMTLMATEGAKVHAINTRIRKCIDLVEQGYTAEKIAAHFDEERMHRVELSCSQLFSKMTGERVEIKITRLQRGARRPSALAKGFLSLDCDADVEVRVGSILHQFTGLLHKAAPSLVLGTDDEALKALTFAAVPIDELILTPHTIINVTIPAVVYALMTGKPASEVAEMAEQGAWISSGTPGAKHKAVKAIYSAKRYIRTMTGSMESGHQTAEDSGVQEVEKKVS